MSLNASRVPRLSSSAAATFLQQVKLLWSTAMKFRLKKMKLAHLKLFAKDKAEK